MKVIVYEEDKITELVNCLNTISVTGIEQARILAQAADIIDTGKRGNSERTEKGDEK